MLAALEDPVAAIDAFALALATGVAAVTLVIAIVVHEAAHVVVARAVGFDVLEIHIGAGPCVWSRWLGPVLLVLRKWPFVGIVWAYQGGRRWLRTRMVAWVAAGPLASVGFAVAMQQLGPVTDDLYVASAFGAATVMAWWIAAVSLLPQRLPGGVRSDVMNVWAALRTRPSEADERAALAARARPEMEMRRAFFRGERQRAAALLTRLLEERPGDAALLEFAALLRLAEGDADAALCAHLASEAAGAEAAAAGPPPPARATASAGSRRAAMRLSARRTAEVNRVFFQVHVGTPEAIDAADRTSAAWLARPGDPLRHAMLRTRGLVLVHAGSIEQGLRSLRQALRGSEPAWLRALGMSYVAYAHALRGERAQAHRWLRRARRIDRNGLLLALHERLVEAALAAP